MNVTVFMQFQTTLEPFYSILGISIIFSIASIVYFRRKKVIWVFDLTDLISISPN